MTVKEFFDVYWQHYLLLEDDFLATKRYLEIDDFNKTAYSTEYSKQFQTICSEIDVFCKELCKEIDGSQSADKIQHYCKVITDSIPDFTETKINVLYWDKEIYPWRNWSYKISIDKNGILKINSNNNPKWWTLYNKVKHQRTTKKKSYKNIPFYKYANQENIINSLGALYILEMKCLGLILKKVPKEDDEECICEFEKSKLFYFDSQKIQPKFEILFIK